MHPEYGRCINLAAKVVKVAGDASTTLSGHKLYWYIVPNPANKTGLTGTAKAGFGAGGGAMKLPNTSGADGWSPTVKFFPSSYGGDKFDVYVTENKNYTGGLKAGTYTVWRRMWYQITEMKDSTGSPFAIAPATSAGMEAGMKAVFIEFSEETPRTQVAHKAILPNDTALTNVSKTRFRRNKKMPFKVHILTVDYCNNPIEKTLTCTMKTPQYTTKWYHLWNRGTATHPWKIKAEYRWKKKRVWYCNRIKPKCPGHESPSHRCPVVVGADKAWTCGAKACPGHAKPTDVCKKGVWFCRRTHPACPGHKRKNHRCPGSPSFKWSCGAKNCPGHASHTHKCGHNWKNIPDAKLSLSAPAQQRGYRKIKINFTGGPATPSNADQVEVRLKVKLFEGVTLGKGGYDQYAFLCSGALRDVEKQADWNTVQRSDMAHEVGHALGMLNMPPQGNTAHTGWAIATDKAHCSKGKTVCLMHPYSSTQRPTTFHTGDPSCHDSMRAQVFDRGKMSHWKA